MDSTINPLLCDPLEGICELPASKSEQDANVQADSRSILLVYFTDPICSSCWGIEPQLRKLKLEYGNSLKIDYRMGGLLPDWSYNSGGISKPSDVAHHWDEVSVHYDMPIDGDIWIEDPLHSSYPPSIAFKAAQLQDLDKAVRFLRIIREMVFLQKKNITKWEHLKAAAQLTELDIDRFKYDFEGRAKVEFEKDLASARQFGVRGFPTMFFLDDAGNRETVYGTKPYSEYQNAILRLNPSLRKKEYPRDWQNLFSLYSSLTAKEFTELAETDRSAGENQLDQLAKSGDLEKQTTKNGSIWTMRATH